MKRAASVTALAIVMAAGGAVESAAAKAVCTRGSDARVIEIITPGVVGQSCDVRYTRGGGSNVSVPYHADNSAGFCTRKARELATRLADSGFVCVEAAPALRADAGAAADYVVEARRAEPATQPAGVADVADEASAPAATPQMQSAPSPEPAPELAREPAIAAAPSAAGDVAAAPSAAGEVAAAADASALEDEMNKILAQPAIDETPGEPAQLVAQRAEPPARPEPTPVGRLVGAEPETVRSATTMTQASLQEPASAEPEGAPTPAAQPEAPPPTLEAKKPTPAEQNAAPPVQPGKVAPKASSQLREPADVVRATLMAQAAAWNEGDLDSFMRSYWKSDELKFVSGVNITRGWNATMKRYRDRYSGGEGLGQLGFEKMDVKLITDDVAIVTGRFNLARSDETSSGTFSLVMRRDAGAWRIVHDHTSPDPAP